MDDRPKWAQRLTAEREARSWSQLEMIPATRAHSSRTLPDDASLLHNWKLWEAGTATPDTAYQGLIAAAFGTVAAAIWPVVPWVSRHKAELADTTGMSTLEVLTRLRASVVDQATLDAMRVTADQLCTDYPHLSAQQFLVEGRARLNRMSSLMGTRLALAQHREFLIRTRISG